MLLLLEIHLYTHYSRINTASWNFPVLGECQLNCLFPEVFHLNYLLLVLYLNLIILPGIILRRNLIPFVLSESWVLNTLLLRSFVKFSAIYVSLLWMTRGNCLYFGCFSLSFVQCGKISMIYVYAYIYRNVKFYLFVTPDTHVNISVNIYWINDHCFCNETILYYTTMRC